MHHLVSVEQLSAADISELFERADVLREMTLDPSGRRELAGRYVGEQMCSLFYEPSTRTRLSFEQAATKFGMGVVSTENAREFSSAAKGETIEDTIRVLDEYDFSVVVLRHDETGAARRAAEAGVTPVINAGDGKGEHPTQALLDMYTIDRYAGRSDGLNIVIGGDLARGRTARSLAMLLARHDKNSITFVSTPELRIGDDVKAVLTDLETAYEETDQMLDAFRDADVVYWTRMQKERALEGAGSSEGQGFQIDEAALDVMPEHALIMHPLPRVDEIAPEVDADPRAQYFKQAGNGLYVRMALIDKIMQSSSHTTAEA